MKIIYKLSELEKLKKLYVAIGLDTKKIDDAASKKGVQVKSEATLKAEIKAQVDIPVNPSGKV